MCHSYLQDKVYQEKLFIGSLGKINKVDRNTSKNLTYNVKAVSPSAYVPNKNFKDISENKDFFDVLQANRSPYKPILEGITDDEEDFCFISWINLIALLLWILTLILGSK